MIGVYLPLGQENLNIDAIKGETTRIHLTSVTLEFSECDLVQLTFYRWGNTHFRGLGKDHVSSDKIGLGGDSPAFRLLPPPPHTPVQAVVSQS